MKTEWRPDNWKDFLYIAGTVFILVERDNQCFEAGASAMLSARDKWWLCLLQEVNEANDLKDLQERFAHLLRYVADLGIKREVGQ